MTETLIETLNNIGINPLDFENMSEYDKLQAISNVWNKLGENKINNDKQQIINLKHRIKFTKNPMMIKQLQQEINKLSKTK